jgi:hypothetical protein
VPFFAILEDDAGRREAMSLHGKRLGELIFFASAHSMIAWLREHLGECALISLDHDLVALESGEDPACGRYVVDFLVEQKVRCPVIVHTSNAIYAPSMTCQLERAGWRFERVPPFNDLEWVETSWAKVARSLLGE